MPSAAGGRSRCPLLFATLAAHAGPGPAAAGAGGQAMTGAVSAGAGRQAGAPFIYRNPTSQVNCDRRQVAARL